MPPRIPALLKQAEFTSPESVIEQAIESPNRGVNR